MPVIKFRKKLFVFLSKTRSKLGYYIYIGKATASCRRFWHSDKAVLTTRNYRKLKYNCRKNVGADWPHCRSLENGVAFATYIVKAKAFLAVAFDFSYNKSPCC